MDALRQAYSQEQAAGTLTRAKDVQIRQQFADLNKQFEAAQLGTAGSVGKGLLSGVRQNFDFMGKGLNAAMPIFSMPAQVSQAFNNYKFGRQVNEPQSQEQLVPFRAGQGVGGIAAGLLTPGNTAKSVATAAGLTATPTTWGTGTASQTIWIAVKVVYTPSTDTWKLYYRDDSNGSTPTYTSDFSTNMNLAGYKSDNTYTGASYSMTNFGFLWNHASTSSSTSNTLFVDNFSLTVNNPTINAPSVSSLSGFTASSAVASAEQSFTISGQYLTNSIVMLIRILILPTR
jgi:hypothetical protein